MCHGLQATTVRETRSLVRVSVIRMPVLQPLMVCGGALTLKTDDQLVADGEENHSDVRLCPAQGAFC